MAKIKQFLRVFVPIKGGVVSFNKKAFFCFQQVVVRLSTNDREIFPDYFVVTIQHVVSN